MMNLLMDELYRLFLGTDISFTIVFEIIFRTAFMYLYTVLNVRLMDKRSMGLLSPFEVIIIIALGSAVGDPMFYRQLPLLPAMMVITTIVFVERLLAKLSMKSRFIERLINGKPVLIIRSGTLIEEAMDNQNISKAELYSILRLRGILHISDVEYAYLEPSGSISIIKKDGSIGSDILPAENKVRGQ